MTLRDQRLYQATSYSFVTPTLLAVLTAAGVASAEGQGWKDSLRTTLESTYPQTKRAALSPDRITHQGAVLVIRKDGIAADPSSDVRYSVTKVRGGQVGEAGGAVAAVFSKTNTRVFRPGERVYVTDIRVGDNDITLLLTSVDMFQIVQKGSTKQTRYKSALKFEFPVGYLATADFAEVRKTIDNVVALEADVAAASTKTIALGQTPEEVEGILGKPQSIVDLGPKKIYVYSNMKITFLEGRVTDVQ